MKYFIYLATIFFMCRPSVQDTILDCRGVNALYKSENLFMRPGYGENEFFTKVLIVNSSNGNFSPVSGFVHEDRLVYTKLRMTPDGVFGACSFSSDENDRYSMNIQYTTYLVDDEKAIFETIDDFAKTSSITTFSDGHPDPITLTPQIKVRFALVYMGNNDSWRIYQTCDKILTWIQIRKETLYSVVNATEDYKIEMIRATNILNIQGTWKFIESIQLPFNTDFESITTQIMNS